MTTTENATQAPTIPAIPAEHFLGLAPGEIRIFEHTVPTGQVITVKLFAVAGGTFTRLEVRSNGGLMPERSGNYQFESAALRDYIVTLRWLVQQ